MSNNQWAEIYGVQPRTIRRWKQLDSDCPELDDMAGVYQWVANRPKFRAKLRPFDEARAMLEAELGKEIDAPELVDGENTAPMHSKEWWEVEKIRLVVEDAKLKLEKLRGNVVEVDTASMWVEDMITRMFGSLELNDEEKAEEWEGMPAVKILEARKIEREKLRNEIANIFEQKLADI